MKIIKNCESYLDILFTEQDISKFGGNPLVAGAYIMSSLEDLAYKQGIDLSEYTDCVKLVADFESFIIVRASYKIKHYSHNMTKETEEFLDTADEYARQYREGKLRFHGEPRAKQADKGTGTYITLTAKNVSQFRPVLSLFRQNAKASLYSRNGQYYLIYKRGSLKKNEAVLREFVDARYINYIQLGVLEDTAKCITKDNAVEVIKNFY